MKLMDGRTTRSVDRSAVRKYGIKGLVLMENAGRGIAEAVKMELAHSAGKSRRVTIITGKGNNGGDGFVAARHLKNSGVDVTVLALARLDEMKGDALVNARSWVKMGGTVFTVLTEAELKKRSAFLTHSSVIVDAIFGTGLKAPVRGISARAIESINSSRKKVVAIDIPSGIDATTGAILGSAVRADLTVTMAAPKLGLYLYPGRSYSGRVEVVDIGCPRELVEDDRIRWNLITEDYLKRVLRSRKADSHKGSHGHLLVVAGSFGMTGAAYMSAMGAMRIGAGIVTVAVPESLQIALEEKSVETMSIGLPETPAGTLGPLSFGKIKEALKGKSALVIGPGFKPSEDIYKLMEMVVKEVRVPLLMDGGALSSLEGRASILGKSRCPVVITPHPGEAGKLLGLSPLAIQADRIASAERLAKATGAAVVLKGAGTVVAAHEEVFINPTGNPALSTAGTGDVLAGVIGGLLAQGYSTLDSAVSGAYIHGLAADILREKGRDKGMIATDLLPVIPDILNSVMAPSKEA
ncbi:MAG: NAD(P)H-hydrate dehydratase [Deltaproteobacteria bacterium]|nr:NAD(P)H-hydrate dehydratase [Deltaproteobacteria bacterium]